MTKKSSLRLPGKHVTRPAVPLADIAKELDDDNKQLITSTGVIDGPPADVKKEEKERAPKTVETEKMVEAETATEKVTEEAGQKVPRKIFSESVEKLLDDARECKIRPEDKATVYTNMKVSNILTALANASKTNGAKWVPVTKLVTTILQQWIDEHADDLKKVAPLAFE